MSLINDALRRAKQAQEQAPLPPTPHLPLRPVEPTQQSVRRGVGLLLPATVAALALLALLFVWHWSQARRRATPTEVNARSPIVPPVTRPAPAPMAQAVPVQKSAFPSSPAAGVAATVVPDAAGAPTDESVDDMEESDATDATSITAPTPPKPAPLRLQGILFSPKQPSAMISSKTLFVGDKLGDLRVVSIDKDSVTLVGAGQTNVLTLAH